MKVINYFSVIAMPILILIILIYGVKEKVKIFDVFLQGVDEGTKIVISLFPTLLGLFVSIGLLRASGIIDMISNIIYPVISILSFPKEIIPLALLRPISGSGSIAVATDIIKNYGVDSKIGYIASIIMGSTETTIYTIAVYTSSVKVKNSKEVLYVALLGDFVGMLVSVIICNNIY